MEGRRIRKEKGEIQCKIFFGKNSYKSKPRKLHTDLVIWNEFFYL